MSYVYIFITIALTVYGQIVLKWQLMNAGAPPTDAYGRISFLLPLFFNPWIISVVVAAMLSLIAWMAAIAQLQLSHAYPFTSATFVLVVILSSLFFHEPITWPKIAGLLLIVAGIVVGSQG